MFLFTVSKPGLRQAAALALCAACLTGTVAAAVHFAGQSVETGAAAETGTIETTQDIATYFGGYGFELDLASATVDKVKIPKKWDDSFAAFNQVVGESGLDLSSYKGRTVEKWTALCPARSNGEKDCYCVLLVYKAKAVGAYLLEKPSGEVTGLVTAAKTAAEKAGAAAETEAQADDSAKMDAGSIVSSTATDKTQAEADTAKTEANAETAAEADSAAEASADVTDPSAWPTE